MSRTVPIPNATPVKTYPTPSWSGEPFDELLIEKEEFNQPSWKKLPEGSPHPNARDYPNHRLVKEEWDGTYGIVTRYWGNGYQNQDQHNYDISYSAESNPHPIFQRRYLVRRDEYSVSTKEQSFSGLYSIQVTNGGSGYDPDNPPTVTINGFSSTTATAKALVSSDGVIKWVYLTNEGAGYSTVPTVSFSSGTATAVAKTQLATGIVSSITLSNQGTGYITVPNVTITGGGGSGAAAVAQIGGGKVRLITVTQYGSGYTSTPTVTISGGGGSGATATATREVITPVLIKEDLQELPDNDQRKSLFIVVLKTWEALPGPVLREHLFEPFIDDWVAVEKRIVLASQVPGSMHWETRIPGQITEYQPLSRHRSIQIVSKIDTSIAWENGGADQVYYGTVNYTFPNEIHDNPSIHVYFAFQNDNLAIDFGWVLNVIEGYSGPCRAKFRRRYTFDPDDPLFVAALPEVTFIQPESDVINDGFTYEGGNLIARATQFIIPSTLHPELTIDVTGTSPPVTNLPGPVSVIEATIPEGIDYGDEIIVSIKPTLWRFGLWAFDIVSVFKPSPPA
jgi:hypothetical protein